jgi:hypothetical protein
MKQKNVLLKWTAIALIATSVLAIIARLPFGGESGLINYRWWTYMIVSAFNLAAGVAILRNVKNSVKFAIAVIIITFIATEIANNTVNNSFSIGFTITSAVIPAIFVFLLYKGMLQKSKK